MLKKTDQDTMGRNVVLSMLALTALALINIAANVP